MNNIRKLAFIGGGNMAAALIGGLTKRGLRSDQVVVADPSDVQLRHLAKQYGVKTATDNASAAEGAEVVVLAVKPQQMRAVALSLAPSLSEARPLLLSVAAGIPHAALARWFGPKVPVVRTMPNRPALNGFGATGLYAPASVGAAHRALAESIMAAVSATVWVEHESQMDTVTALSGSGPAYFFLFMEALEAAAHERGLPNDIAHRLTLRRHSARRKWRATPANRLRCCASKSPRRSARPPRRSRSSTLRVFVLSSRTQWRRPIAARPSSPRNSALIEFEGGRE